MWVKQEGVNDRPRHARPGAAVIMAALAVAIASPATANINLELRPIFTSAVVGDTVNLGLYAVPDNAVNQSISAAEVIIGWNPLYLSLLGNSTVGAVPLLASGFFNDAYNLNDDLTDGDAMWIGLAPLGTPVQATPAGTLLTTIQFQALATTPSTPVSLPLTGGNPVGSTRIFSGDVPNLVVNGVFTGATVEILPIPAPAGLALIALAGIAGTCRRRRIIESEGRA